MRKGDYGIKEFISGFSEILIRANKEREENDEFNYHNDRFVAF
jgi:hypothetical protein